MNDVSAVGPIFGINQATPSRLDALAELLVSLPGERLRILEVGSYEGQSALHWSAALGKAGRRGDIVCIDPWEPYIQEEGAVGMQVRMNTDLRTGAAFERFKRNIGFAHPDAPISYVRGRVRSCFHVSWHFDFAYVDGSHAFSDVIEDLELVAPQVKGGGILCGDDLERQIESPDQECEAWPSREHEWSDQRGGFHPGVSLAVWKFFGGRTVWSRNGAWAMRKNESAFTMPVP